MRSAITKRTSSLRKRQRRVTPSRPIHNNNKNSSKNSSFDEKDLLKGENILQNGPNKTLNGPIRVKQSTKLRNKQQSKNDEVEIKDEVEKEGVFKFKLTNHFAENLKKSKNVTGEKVTKKGDKYTFSEAYINSTLDNLSKPPSITAPLKALGLFPWFLDGSIAKMFIGVLGNLRRQFFHNIYSLTKNNTQKQKQQEQDPHHQPNPVFAAAGVTKNGIEDIIDVTQGVLYKPVVGDALYGKKLPFPFFRAQHHQTRPSQHQNITSDQLNPVLPGAQGDINVLKHLFSQNGTNGSIVNNNGNAFFRPSPFILSLLGLISVPNSLMTFKQVNNRLVIGQKVAVNEINRLAWSTLPYSLQKLISKGQNGQNGQNGAKMIKNQHNLLNLNLVTRPNRINAGLLSLMVGGAPIMSEVQSPQDERLKGLVKDADGLNRMQKNNFFHQNNQNNHNNQNNQNKNANLLQNNPQNVQKSLYHNHEPEAILSNLKDIGNFGQFHAVDKNSGHFNERMSKLRQVVQNQLQNLQKTDTKFAMSISSSLTNPLDSYTIDPNGKYQSLNHQIKKLGLKNKGKRSLMKKIKKFYKKTFFEFSHHFSTQSFITPDTYNLIKSMPMKPPQSLSEYPFFKDIFTLFNEKKSSKLKNNLKMGNKKMFKNDQFKSLSPTNQLIKEINANTFDSLKKFNPLSIQQRAMSTRQHTNADKKQKNNNKKLTKSNKNSSLNPSKTIQMTKMNKTPYNSQQRHYRFNPQPKTERLRRLHISTNTESAPFHYHVSDSLRAVTKFAYMRLSNPHEKLHVQKIRPVLMPFWGFQGVMTLHHKPSKTSKVIDYNDVERNLDTTMYSSILNVREDQLVFGMSSQHLVNPNCSFGSDFSHQETSMIGRKAETYVNQPHTINTLRMRAAQMYSGSEWAPWQMEGLKLHLQMVQEFQDKHLDFPTDPLAPPDFADYTAQYPEYDTKYHSSGSKNVIEAAEKVREGISPLSQSYQDTVKLEKLYPYIASQTIATPSHQSKIPLETDEHIRSERACMIEALVNMVSLEYNLTQRGVGVTTNHQHLSDEKIDQLTELHQNHLHGVGHDRMDDANGGVNKKEGNEQDLKSIYDGAFLSMKEQREMLQNLAIIHHQMNGTKGANMTSVDDNFDKNPLQVPRYTGEKSAIMKAHKYFKAIVKPVEKPQLDKNGKPILVQKKPKYDTNNDPIAYLQERLLDEELDLKYNDDDNNKQKKEIRQQQKQFRSTLRQTIINSFMDPSKTPSPLQNHNEVSFDIPGSDYSVSFSGITSRKVMYPGYIHHYNYLGKQTVISSGVTGVTTGVPHRHYKSVIKSAIKNTIGAGIGAIGLRMLLRRIVLPPIYTVALSTLLVVYSLREVIHGHWRYSSDHHAHGKALSKEFEIEKELYSAASQVGAGVNASSSNNSSKSSQSSQKQAQSQQPTADVMRESWEFQPFEGFYTNNNWKSDNIWNAINDPSPQANTNTNTSTNSDSKSSSSSSSTQQQQPQSQNGPAYRKKAQNARKTKENDDVKRKIFEAEKKKNMPAVIPSDPYLLILGEEFLGIKTKPGGKPPVLRLSQVSQVPIEVVKSKYFEQIKYWHPDTHTDQSPEYAEERTRMLIMAWDLIGNKAKKDQYDRRNYR